jgi:hypothetical protein
MNIGDGVWVSPEMPTTFDFNNHLGKLEESTRRVSGLADYQRGEVKNIRTAAEATMLRGSVEGRLNIRSKKLIRGVTNLFKKGVDVWRWAAANPGASKIDMDTIAYLTQTEADGAQLTEDVLYTSPQFRVLPFSPLMEDKHTRRQQLTELIPTLGGTGPLAAAIDQRELAKELVDDYGFRPSIAKSQERMDAEAQAAMASQGGTMPGAPAGDTIPPELAAQLAQETPQ